MLIMIDAGRGSFFTDILRRVGSVQARHRDIEQDHVGRVQRSQFDRFITIGALGDYIKLTVSFEKGSQAAANERMIVNDQGRGLQARFQHTLRLALSGSSGAEFR